MWLLRRPGGQVVQGSNGTSGVAAATMVSVEGAQLSARRVRRSRSGMGSRMREAIEGIG